MRPALHELNSYFRIEFVDYGKVSTQVSSKNIFNDQMAKAFPFDSIKTR